jgi:hypothetical protein
MNAGSSRRVRDSVLLTLKQSGPGKSSELVVNEG